MLLKNLRPADEYDRFASQALEPWDVMFVTRIRQIARDLPPGALVDIGTATVVVPVRLAADPVLKGWHFIGLDLDETMLDGGRADIDQGAGGQVAGNLADAGDEHHVPGLQCLRGKAIVFVSRA